jgi:hypothetical protein
MMRSCAGLRLVALGGLGAGRAEAHFRFARIQPPASRYQSPAALLAIYDRLRAEIARIPGVERAAIVNHEGAAGVRTDVRLPGETLEPGAEPRALYRLVSAGYFETIGQRLLRGRTFVETDMGSSSRVAVVSAHLAKRLWPADDGLGKVIRVFKQVPGRTDYGEALDVQVVGIVADATFEFPGGPAISADDRCS